MMMIDFNTILNRLGHGRLLTIQELEKTRKESMCEAKQQIGQQTYEQVEQDFEEMVLQLFMLFYVQQHVDARWIMFRQEQAYQKFLGTERKAEYDQLFSASTVSRSGK